MLKLRICTVRQALPFVRRVHRRLPKIQGAMWASSVWARGEMVGVALVGNPPRLLMGDTLQVLRVAVIEGNRNGCSMLYGACSRAARALGAENLVTYTHLDEDGTSLKAAGWIDGGLTDGGEWSRDGRPRQLVLDPEKKRRWWAPWSERAKQLQKRTAAGPQETPIDNLHESRSPDGDGQDALAGGVGDGRIACSPQPLRTAGSNPDDSHTTLGPQETPQWQPIETAPKEGLFVLLHDNGFTRDAMVTNGETLTHGRTNHTWTHWMPLHAPPQCGTPCETEGQL